MGSLRIRKNGAMYAMIAESYEFGVEIRRHGWPPGRRSLYSLYLRTRVPGHCCRGWKRASSGTSPLRDWGIMNIVPGPRSCYRPSQTVSERGGASWVAPHVAMRPDGLLPPAPLTPALLPSEERGEKRRCGAGPGERGWSINHPPGVSKTIARSWRPLPRPEVIGTGGSPAMRITYAIGTWASRTPGGGSRGLALPSLHRWAPRLCSI
jgi:hypothetical protein